MSCFNRALHKNNEINHSSMQSKCNYDFLLFLQTTLQMHLKIYQQKVR
jgi:hypothetical protein